MSQIEELERRIAGALDRIAAGLEQGARAAVESQEGETPPAGADPATAELAELRQALEDERLAVAQWQERNKRLRHQRDAARAELEAARGPVAEQIASLDAELQTLRKANEQLRDNNARLRAANAAGLADADLINAGLGAELEALRAARATDRAESDLVMAELSAAIAGARPDAEQEEA